ncbi:type II/IV secretion system protein, partial [Dolichospermum sp. ST_sed10]|nr:type II/IV secretion system protein [Dolichospermum sp. ST_sed10]
MNYSSSQGRSTALTTRTEFSPFGNKLVTSGYVNNEQMRRAVIDSRKSGKPLTEVLESITGRQLSPELVTAYKKQHLFELKILYGVEYLDPEIKEIDTRSVGTLIKQFIPIEICRRHQLLPLSTDNNQNPTYVVVAMVDPDNLDASDDLNRILRPKNLSLQRRVITQKDYQNIINQYLNEEAARQKILDQEKIYDVKEDLDNLDRLDIEENSDNDVDLDQAIKGADDAPIIKLVNRILLKALTEGVSDIHIEPQEEYLRIRFRKDGVLREA